MQHDEEGGTKRNGVKHFRNSIFGITANTTAIRHVDEAASFVPFHEASWRLRSLGASKLAAPGASTTSCQLRAVPLSKLAASGASVAICGRRSDPLDTVRDELSAAGADCLALPTDVREPEQVGAFLDRVDERFGRVDILVNNAGGQFAAPLEDVSLKGLRAVHRLNVDASFDVTQRVAARNALARYNHAKRHARGVQRRPGF